MTLHWWMHWFWITANIGVILANPLPSTTEEPRSQDKTQTFSTELPSSSTEIKQLEVHLTTELNQQENFRIAKAIGIYPPLNTAEVITNRQTTPSDVTLTNFKTKSLESTSTNSKTKPFEDTPVNSKTKSKCLPESVTLDVLENKTSVHNNKSHIIRMPNSKKDSKVSWILTSNKTSRTKSDEKASEVFRNWSTSEYESLTVLPLQDETSRFKLVVNRSTLTSPKGGKMKTTNASGDLVVEEDFTEPQSIATAASVLEAGLSESTRLSRARSAFTSNFQRDQKQEESHRSEKNDKREDNVNSGTEHNSASASVADIAIITGSCLASLALLSTVTTVGFIMYRRRYLNPPQSLNSDKCSNPDSSGYIDDSTIRDNSEEMYSLDNDSFLNSLEAMTIQNYWTDSVKHTKL